MRRPFVAAILLVQCLVLLTQAVALPSGSPLRVATETYEDKIQDVATPPLSVGIVTKPLGAANVFGGKLPDLFLVNSKESTHPGLFLYQYVSTDAKGAPRFKRRFQITHPFKGLIPPPGHIVEFNGTIHGIWIVESNIVAHTFYDKVTHGFVERREMHIQGLPRPPVSIVFLPDGEHRGDLVFEIPDRATPSVVRSLDSEGDRYRRMTYNPKDGLEENHPRDSSGMWRLRPIYSSLFSVHISQFTASPSHTARRLTPNEHDMQYGYSGISGFITQEKGGKRRKSVIVGSHYNGIHLFHGQTSASSFSVRPRQPLKSAIRSNVNSRVLKHPSPLPMPLAFPSKRGYTNILVGGEGALQFYKFMGFSKDSYMPLYSMPSPVLEVNALLYGGSHPAVSVIDWDNDGRTDIIAGNAEGRILFFKNVGTDQYPRFLAGIPVKHCIVEVKNGKSKVHPNLLKEIRLQAGYQALNGPAESSYGYATPSVVDWNGDGFPDIVTTDALGRHSVYLNTGISNRLPIVQPPIELFCDDRELQGPWRIKPGTGRHQGRLVYVVVDADNHLHAYYKMDNQNLKDAGKLKLIDGKPIQTHYLLGSAVGRIHINLVDFDSDNILDLILAVPAHASVPSENRGIPQALGLPGGAVLFMKGKRSQSRGIPTFFPPEVIHHDGHPLFIGREDGSVAVTSVGNSTGPHLLVGEEGGRLVFYDRKHLSCKTYNRFPLRTKKAGSDKVSDDLDDIDQKYLTRYLRSELEKKELDLSVVPDALIEDAQGRLVSQDEEDFFQRESSVNLSLLSNTYFLVSVVLVAVLLAFRRRLLLFAPRSLRTLHSSRDL